MITDYTYYLLGEYEIPNVKDISAEPVDAPSVKSELEVFIDRCERDVLLDAFGPTLYNQLKTANDDLPNAAQKWKDLVDGADYTLDGKTYRWDGLKGYEKNSLLAAYVFCKYLKNDDGRYTTVGIVKNKAKNANVVSPMRKYLTAWNNFLNLYQDDCKTNTVRSLWQFLNDYNKKDASNFPDFDDYFKFYKNLNPMGI